MMTLVERLEQATEGSAELDDAIHECIINLGIDHHAYQSPTQILDHAVALVPTKHWWGIETTSVDCYDAFVRGWGDETVWINHVGRTPALALCIAALRAREAGDA